MEKKQCDDNVCIESLSERHSAAYMDAFSESVRVPLHVQSIESEELYLKNRLAQKAPFFFAVIVKNTNQLIGAIEIRDACHRSQLYCWINEKWWGSGVFQNAMQLAAQCYFTQTNEAVISARVDYSNARSVHALEKVGFTVEGTAPGPREKQYALHLER